MRLQWFLEVAVAVLSVRKTVASHQAHTRVCGSSNRLIS